MAKVQEHQLRYLVGAANLLKRDPQLYEQAKLLNTGPVRQRLRFVVVAGELAGPEEALRQLEKLRARLRAPSRQRTAGDLDALGILTRLYDDYSEKKFDALTEEERQQLRDELGWFGELALAPPEAPNRPERAQVLAGAYPTVILFLGGVGGGAMVGVVGFAGLIVLTVSQFSGRLRGALDERTANGGIYAETFAVWIVVFLALEVAAEFAPVVREAQLFLKGIAMVLSLSALAWPVYRGIPWRQVRAEIGLTAGRRPVLE